MCLRGRTRDPTGGYERDLVQESVHDRETSSAIAADGLPEGAEFIACQRLRPSQRLGKPAPT